MILGSDLDRLDRAITYWYEGICPYSGEILRLPRTLEAEAIARDLMQSLGRSQCDHGEGKMYGVLIAESSRGERLILKAFSGLLNGKSEIEGWVPPIAGRERVAIAESITLHRLAKIKQELIELSQIAERGEYERRSQEYATQFEIMRERHHISKQERHQQRQQERQQDGADLSALDRASQMEKMERRNFKRDRDLALLPLKQAIELADTQMQNLKQERRELSRTLQNQMHHAYVLTNFAGETRSLKELITEGAMPTGTGDCCAPKLLHYAAIHHLAPIALAEFWWGSPAPDGYKMQGEFYGACVERCQPLMGFLLSGRNRNALDRAGEDAISLENENEEKIRFQSSLTSIKSGKIEVELPIMYEDDYLIAIAKPEGLLSVPGRYLDTQDSVLSRLRQYFSDRASLYPVHRLDRQTSGILLLARDLDSLRHLHLQFQQRQVRKVYEALLSGECAQKCGMIDLPLWGNPENRPYQQVDFAKGKPSLTEFRLLGIQDHYTRIEFIPLTGRTHQLRVHAADPRGLGLTILGDRLYGCQIATDRLHLHARELTFTHPRSLEEIRLQIPVPF
ncbi:MULTISPECIES: RluA family pseudouridine synthase [Pseudanabaena]|nr:pseudouridine synthase [Pseudanabaena biceps PCC 7429]